MIYSLCCAGLATKLSPTDKSTVEEAVNDAVKWLEKNPEATVDEFSAQQETRGDRPADHEQSQSV